jgi:PAS domain S-box-containing protein
MTRTVSCDHAGADALLRVYQRSSMNGTRLRAVVTAPLVRRILDVSGLDRLISIYPSVETAVAADAQANVVPLAAARPRADRSRSAPPASAVNSAVLLGVVDALGDGVVLANSDGAIALANRRAEEMFGYAHGELVGRPVDSLIPADLRAAHAGLRAGYLREPSARRMGERARLVGLRRDGSTFPARISLSPVPTATARFTLAVIRDTSEAQPRADLVDLARAAAAARHSEQGQELLDRVVNRLFQVGLSLQAAIDLPHNEARQQIAEGLARLDETIHEIHDHIFAGRDRDGPPDPAFPNGSG